MNLRDVIAAEGSEMTMSMIRTSVKVAVVVFALLGLASPAAAQCSAADPDDWTPDTGYLQDCLDAGGTIVLERGNPGYILDGGLELHVDGTILTATGSKALLIAASGLSETMLAVADTADDYEISELIFDGNKSNRSNGSTLCQGYRGPASNLLLRGTGFVVHHIDSINTLCGSAMEIIGSDFEIYSNYIADSGFEGSQQSSWSEPWADGITVIDCDGGDIHNNVVVESTDIGIVVGASDACTFRWNEVEQSSRYAFAGIQIAAFEDEAEHYLSTFQYNYVVSAYDKTGAGIMVGSHPWDAAKDLYDAGSVVQNDSEGAVVNLTIDGVRNGTVSGNDVTSAQGSRGLSNCSASDNYTAAHFESGLTVQSGYVVRYYHPGQCYQ
jgi:parallel beta-helix repeat protein